MKEYLTSAIFVCVVLHHPMFVGACYDGYVRYGDSCYHVSFVKNTWADAMTICKLENGNLAAIESETENAFVAQLLKNHSVPQAWIAATDLDVVGDWRWWPSKETLTYSNWDTGEPNRSGAENCARIYMQGHYGKWNDADCNLASNYICEVPYERTAVIG